MNRNIRISACFLIAITCCITSVRAASDADWQAMSRYEYGQNMKPLLAIDREAIEVVSSPQKRVVFAARLANLLTDKNATPAAKQFICQKLQTVGTSAEVPQLAKMLVDPKTSEMARMAIENIPAPQSLAALRDSLDVLHGDLLIGAMNSLAARKDAKAVPKLKALAVGADAEIARAAFWALGNIADSEAIAFIVEKAEAARDPLPLETAVLLLRAAEALTAAGHADRAMPIFDKLAANGQPTGVRCAALSVILKKEKAKRTQTILAWLAGPDADRRVVAASHLASLPEAELDDLTAKLSELPTESRLGLIEVLVSRKGKDTLPLVLSLVESNDTEMKLAGVRMLGQIGDPATIPVLIDCLAAGDNIEVTARQSLSMLPRKAVGEAMLAALTDRPEIRDHVLEVLEQLKYYEAIDALVDLAAKDDAASYRPALAALAGIADPDEHDLPRLLKLLPAAQGEHRQTVERTIFIVCQKSSEKNRVHPLLKYLEKIDDAQRPLYLPLLGRFGGDEVLQTIDASLVDKNAETKAAALHALCNWPNADVAGRLWSVVASEDNAPQSRRQALRAYVRMVTLKSNRPEEQTLAMLQKAMKTATTSTDRKWVLERAATVRSLPSVVWIASYLDDPDLNQTACRSIVELAHHRFLRTPNKKEFDRILNQVKTISNDPQIVERAKRYMLGL